MQLLRADESRLRGLLTGWELFTAHDRRLTPWRETDRARSIWCRRSSVAPWALEVLLADTADDRWVYRRDPRITRQVAELGAVADEVPYLRPEIQLLFKSKMVRPKDEADFQATLPLLDDAARDWLQDSLAVVSALDIHGWTRFDVGDTDRVFESSANASRRERGHPSNESLTRLDVFLCREPDARTHTACSFVIPASTAPAHGDRDPQTRRF
ncbi:MAG TPA: hypothetical protein VGC41_09695 [Kofleriaceae bacterium]